ncbi:fatty acid conjugase [Punctularia strigosozonata HHB-11173 SS5]|uniref:fatty acid conjugase n=1 Tax=Punctularia strigosozonata (strain HHB-11173) TaxID=741275 RepID=UPI0004418217|nr:fatty acid conjugase [Punctularia strigosozonata HHB-11173 SS5]EIN09269.1 fatty acid conjugase [Punctularia strigosozonata HHB-11173 SS5]
MSLTAPLFSDAPEYEERKRRAFKAPTQVTISQVRAVVPRKLFERSTSTGLYFVARTIGYPVLFWLLSSYIGDIAHATRTYTRSPTLESCVRGLLWVMYWWWQGIAFTGIWCLAHEAGHESLSPKKWINHVAGFALHSFVFVPYFSWRSVHRAHHKATGSLERDEIYVPRSRSHLGIPPESTMIPADYKDIFDETPLYVFGKIVIMQLFGLPSYLMFNVKGSLKYPKGTNHFLPSSVFFKPSERNLIIASDVGLVAMAFALHMFKRLYGYKALLAHYVIPYLLSNHWIIMLTYLQHTDPTIPHYRGKTWSFVRGALATVDRPFMGWIGRHFLHNASHDHLAHHFFSNIPFYNQPNVTAHLKELLKDDYNYDTTNCFRALYRTFTECRFIEDSGEIVFYKNAKGETARQLAE